jgi:predicted porin
MKKTLIALAIIGTSTGAAMASGNSVQLYGTVDLGITHFTGLNNGAGATASSTGLSSGVLAPSRIGVKGTEDLGGGTTVGFVAETGFCAAGTSQDGYVGQAGAAQTYCTGGGFMGRQSYLDLAGSFGSVTAGRMFTPIFLSEANVDPFGDSLTGQAENISPVAIKYGLNRFSQAVTYATPDLSGFTGTVSYVFSAGSGTVPGATPGTSNVPRAIDLDGAYTSGPVYAVLDYTQLSNYSANPVSGVNDGKLSMWLAGGTYDLGVVKLAALYEHTSLDYTSGSTKYWMLGGTIPVGAGAVMVSYNESKDSQQGTAKQVGIGYTYSMSKQTSLYTSYARLTNDSATASQTGTAYAVGTATDYFSGVTGQASTGFTVGIVHHF